MKDVANFFLSVIVAPVVALMLGLWAKVIWLALKLGWSTL